MLWSLLPCQSLRRAIGNRNDREKQISTQVGPMSAFRRNSHPEQKDFLTFSYEAETACANERMIRQYSTDLIATGL